MVTAYLRSLCENDLLDFNRRRSTTIGRTSKLPVAMAVQPTREDICIVDGANERIMIRSDNYSSVLSSREMLALGETDRQDSMNIILIIGLASNAYEYLSQILRGGVGRRKFILVIVADALHAMPNQHKYPTSILSQLLNNMNKDSTFVNVTETEGYIHSKDRLFCVGLKQFDMAGKSNCVVSLFSPMLQCNSELGEVKLCVKVTHMSLMCIHKLCMARDLWKEILQQIRVPDISLILFLAHTLNIYRNDGVLANGDHHKDKTIRKPCVDRNIVQLLWSDTPIVFRCVVNVDWISIERCVFRSWPLRELGPELSGIVNLGEGSYVTDVLKRLLAQTQNTQTLTRHENGLKVHVSGISNDPSEVQPRGSFHQNVQILLLLTEISYITKSLVENIFPKNIANENIAFKDDKGNDEGEIVPHDQLTTADDREQKTVVQSVDQLHALHINNDTSQYLSETHEENMSSTFDKREAYNLFQNFSDKNLECTIPTLKKKAGEELKYVGKDSLYGDEFTRYLNTWQEVTVAPFYSLRHYFRKVETGENDEKMMYEALRLGSFCGININAFCIRLAEAGFYATGDGDETRCFSCGVRHRGWQQKDNPFLIHRQIAPSCPLITGDDRRNVPINPNAEPSSFSVLLAEAKPVPGGDAGLALGANTNEDLSNQSQIPETYPTISTTSYVSCDGGDKEASASPDLLDRSDRAAADAGQDHTAYILRFEDAVYPNYSDNKVRMASFKTWPQSHCKRPEDLVPVGFFYAGYSDCVRCFVCGVGLRTWEEGDDPWVEHVRWRSSCAYVKAIKGDLFITQTLAVVGQKFRTEQTITNIPSRRAEIVSTRNDSDDILDGETCQRALEMGYTRDCVRKHALYILRNQGSDSLKLHLLVERILQEDVTEMPEPAAATIQAPSASLPPTKSHGLPAPGGETDRPTSPPQGDKYTGTLSGQQQGPVDSDGEDDAYNDTEEPRTFSSGDRYQSMPTLPSDRSRIRSSRTAKIKTHNTEDLEATEEETQQLRQSSACKICLEDPANIVFLPCGHLVACAMCAPALERCPVCRKHIHGSVRVHLADMGSVTSS